MLCKIADLIVEVPDAGGMAPRCKDYLYAGDLQPDITIKSECYDSSRYHPEAPEHLVAYMESARQFSGKLIAFRGFYLHYLPFSIQKSNHIFYGLFQKIVYDG
jgi:hypothetical protein